MVLLFGLLAGIPDLQRLVTVSNHYDLLCQKETSGKFCDNGHRFYFNIELMYTFNKLSEGVFDNMVTMRSAWIPKQYRGQGLFHTNMEILLEYAKGANVAIVGVANPFDLSQGDTPTQNDEIFINDRGFRYLPDYEDAKMRQRQRMRSLGFRPTKLDNIGDRGRIKKKDRLMFRPEGFDREVLRAIAGQNK